MNEYMQLAINDVVTERERHTALALGGNTRAFDSTNTPNDWIAYVNAYLGRATRKVLRNEKEKCEFRSNMVKAASLCLAAIEAHDRGYFEGPA